MEQEIKIKACNDDGSILGTFIITIEIQDNSYLASILSENRVHVNDNVSLKNVPIVEKFDDKTPIQYYKNSTNEANILLLEETKYKIQFESKSKDLDVFHTLKTNFVEESEIFEVNGNIFGVINFKSYAGKTFLDIVKDNKTLFAIPIEIRSKKINYNNQYPAMIGDLSKYSSGLIFEVNSPLYQSFELTARKRKTNYEDFMLLEYLFRNENLPSTFEYLSKNMYSSLENTIETVPTSLASNIGPNELINMFSNPEYLHKDINSKIGLSNKLNGYVPTQIEEIKYIDNIDVPENRFYKNFLESIDYLINDLIKHSSEGYVKDKLLEYKELSSYFLSQRYFKDISKMDYAPLNSQVLQKREGYRDILQYFLMFEFGFKLNWNQVTDEFRGFEKKLSQLYEYWCYFELINVVKNLTDSKINFEDVFEINQDNWNIILKEGIIKEFDFEIEDKNLKINLLYNKTFSNFNEYYNSYSITYRPDYSLEFIYNDKRRIIHFDAKYKVDFSDESAKNEDITKMHAYKEAIPNTIGSFVLFPGEKEEIFEDNKDDSIGVGAFPLTPGEDKFEKINLMNFIKKSILNL